MKLDEVTAVLRPRSDWEAIDLGLAMVRRDFWQLCFTWWLGMLPMLLVLPFLYQHPFWFCFLFWWWMPVASRMVLFRLSRRLFGDDLGWKDLWREFPRAIKRRFFFRMFWARVSPWRPLTMPVEDLEGLRGKDYAVRCRILMRRGDSSVIVLALWRGMLTFWVAGAVFFTGMLFVPETLSEAWNETLRLWWDGDGVEPPFSLAMGVIASFCVSLCLVDMFSVGAGFGIYVNHRTWIEGWDVELAFRRLGNRLQGIAGLLLAGFLLLAGLPLSAQDGEQAEVVIENVLADQDFEVHSETIMEPVPWTWDWLDWLNWGGGSGGGGFLAFLSGLVKIMVVVGLVGFVVWLCYRYRHIFAVRGGGSAKRVSAKATVVMGMDVAPESLPEDVAATALTLWRAGQHHQAMSLLYRGSISWMITRAGVEIAESDTESDCLKQVHQAGAGHEDYFEGLTQQWIALAYALEKPADDEIERLCGQWPFSEGRVE